MIRENLRLTVDQRFRQLMELQRFAEELQNAGRLAADRPKDLEGPMQAREERQQD